MNMDESMYNENSSKEEMQERWKSLTAMAAWGDMHWLDYGLQNADFLDSKIYRTMKRWTVAKRYTNN
jgi:hypothetical protein